MPGCNRPCPGLQTFHLCLHLIIILAFKHGLLPQLCLHAVDLVFHGLFPISAGPHLDGGGDTRGAHLMNHFMAAFDGRKDRIPLPFNVGAVGMQRRLQPCLAQYLFAGCDIAGDGNLPPTVQHRDQPIPSYYPRTGKIVCQTDPVDYYQICSLLCTEKIPARSLACPVT